MGRSSALGADHFTRWHDTYFQLQRLRQSHRRTRRAGACHSLRIRRQPALGQPPHQSGRQPTSLPLRQLATQPHRD
nr:hypothetical protein [Pseudomonas sp. MWU16-30322]